MSSPLDTRKPARSLTLADFAAWPIWAYADDEEGVEGRDETWVRPVDARAVPRRTYTLVAAHFRLACGREYAGNIAVSRFEDPPDIFNGVVHTEDGVYLIPNPDLVHFEHALAELLNGLHLPRSAVFPITYTLRVPFEGEGDGRSGILDPWPTEAIPPDPRPMSFW